MAKFVLTGSSSWGNVSSWGFSFLGDTDINDDDDSLDDNDEDDIKFGLEDVEDEDDDEDESSCCCFLLLFNISAGVSSSLSNNLLSRRNVLKRLRLVEALSEAVEEANEED